MMGLMKTTEQFASIRNGFNDDISKDIYDNLVFYRLTGKNEYIHKIVRDYCGDAKTKRNLCSLIENNRGHQNDKIVLFGAATFAYDVYKYLDEFGIEVFGICDNDENKQKNGFGIGNYPVMNPKNYVPQNLDAIYLITAIDYFVKTDIKAELINYGVPEENIVFGLTYYGRQYFDGEIVQPDVDGVFVDCGSLDCITCVFYREWVGGKYKKIYSFEPDPINIKNCEDNIVKHGLERISLLPYGVWDKKETLHFNCAKGGSSISDKGDCIVNTISIDEVLNGEQATFIKMDIEGAELKALMGAKKTIQKWHPTLAISIYHKPEDLIEIPEYIREICPEYKLYLRHYSSNVFESVLYAIL